uniref:Olfactory receptor n=1 Tax=Neovison vison TaxID=452646 RepID=A0A8C7C0D6_NEOVI
MDGKYCTSVNEFLLLGISNNPGVKMTLFITFLIVYLIILVANLGMIILIRMGSHLHTPMYFFLSHLSFSDLCYSTAVGPRMLVGFIAKNKSIPFHGCALQWLVFCTFVDSECLLLAVMAFDRYKAISNPLLYTVSMSSRLCSLLMAGVYMVAIVDASVNTILTFRLCFCGSNVINRFFCDVLPVALGPQERQPAWHGVNASSLYFDNFLRLFVSYCYIILAVIKINSAEGRFKAFSTCTSHLTAVAIFQGTLLFMYFWPSSSYSLDQDKITSLFYTLVIPMLNPLIYSLWNKDVKDALKNLKNKKWFY